MEREKNRKEFGTFNYIKKFFKRKVDPDRAMHRVFTENEERIINKFLINMDYDGLKSFIKLLDKLQTLEQKNINTEREQENAVMRIKTETKELYEFAVAIMHADLRHKKQGMSLILPRLKSIFTELKEVIDNTKKIAEDYMKEVKVKELEHFKTLSVRKEHLAQLKKRARVERKRIERINAQLQELNLHEVRNMEKLVADVTKMIVDITTPSEQLIKETFDDEMIKFFTEHKEREDEIRNTVHMIALGRDNAIIVHEIARELSGTIFTLWSSWLVRLGAREKRKQYLEMAERLEWYPKAMDLPFVPVFDEKMYKKMINHKIIRIIKKNVQNSEIPGGIPDMIPRVVSIANKVKARSKRMKRWMIKTLIISGLLVGAAACPWFHPKTLDTLKPYHEEVRAKVKVMQTIQKVQPRARGPHTSSHTHKIRITGKASIDTESTDTMRTRSVASDTSDTCTGEKKAKGVLKKRLMRY